MGGWVGGWCGGLGGVAGGVGWGGVGGGACKRSDTCAGSNVDVAVARVCGAVPVRWFAGATERFRACFRPPGRTKIVMRASPV